MIRVGLARGPAHYQGLEAPWHPDFEPPELQGRLDPNHPPGKNAAFRAVRSSLLALGLDQANAGSRDWNPLKDLVDVGKTVVLKPNFIRHWNPASDETEGASVESVITHGAIIRCVAEYAFLAVGASGRVIIAEAPQQDCDFGKIRKIAGLDAMQAHFRSTIGMELEIIDLRREAVVFENGVIVSRQPLPGDPLGYRSVDLGKQSFFEGSGIDPNKMRGADYDPGPTSEHHSKGRNAYLLSETVLASDLIINLPKLKTHKKTGVTLALKNMVGINGDKNWLPHHCAGSVATGGDEFPGGALIDRARSRLTEWGRTLLGHNVGKGLIKAYRRAETRARGDEFIRAGNWYGNRTTWRMCADLNRCIYYSDKQGLHLEAPSPVRKILTVLDGLVAGEMNGPLAPRDVPLGVVLSALDPIALDLAAVRLMGFDEARIPKLQEVMTSSELRVTEVRKPSDVEIAEGEAALGNDLTPPRVYPLHSLQSPHRFIPHSGWLNHIEQTADHEIAPLKTPEEANA
ncbi:MAG: DUF362 domain-containing protein [Myxococcota bacterium]|jgi:uncharacterized protein (DUF362 family)|nr:DUF362 domain-containing protein [Myxococcota bacterium]